MTVAKFPMQDIVLQVVLVYDHIFENATGKRIPAIPLRLELSYPRRDLPLPSIFSSTGGNFSRDSKHMIRRLALSSSRGGSVMYEGRSACNLFRDLDIALCEVGNEIRGGVDCTPFGEAICFFCVHISPIPLD